MKSHTKEKQANAVWLMENSSNNTHTFQNKSRFEGLDHFSRQTMNTGFMLKLVQSNNLLHQSVKPKKTTQTLTTARKNDITEHIASHSVRKLTEVRWAPVPGNPTRKKKKKKKKSLKPTLFHHNWNKQHWWEPQCTAELDCDTKWDTGDSNEDRKSQHKQM